MAASPFDADGCHGAAEAWGARILERPGRFEPCGDLFSETSDDLPACALAGYPGPDSPGGQSTGPSLTLMLGDAAGRIREISVPPLPSIAQLGERLAKWRPPLARSGLQTVSPAAKPPPPVDSGALPATETRRTKRLAPETAVVLRHLSLAIDGQSVGGLLDQLGLQCTYDTIYTARGGEQHMSPGDVVVNFLRPMHAEACIRLCDGQRFSGEACAASFAECSGGDVKTACMAAHVRQSERALARCSPPTT